MLTIARWVQQTSGYLNQLGERLMGKSPGVEETNRPLTENEVQISNSVPAIFTNRFFISMSPGGVRITFTEQQSEIGDPAVRSAVIMHIEDGIALYKTLENLLKEAEETLKLHRDSISRE